MLLDQELKAALAALPNGVCFPLEPNPDYCDRSSHCSRREYKQAWSLDSTTSGAMSVRLTSQEIPTRPLCHIGLQAVQQVVPFSCQRESPMLRVQKVRRKAVHRLADQSHKRSRFLQLASRLALPRFRGHLNRPDIVRVEVFDGKTKTVLHARVQARGATVGA